MLRRGNETASEPNIVAIGPYHRRKDHLQLLEDLKLRCFKSTLQQREECDASKYVEAISRLEPDARRCYSESTENIDGSEFVEMLLLDACFIIQLMRWYLNYNAENNIFFMQDWMLISSTRDILLFENQIPLFVLQELFSMIKMPQEPSHFHELALQFLTLWLEDVFRRPMYTMLELCLSNKLDFSDVSHIEHILGLSHYILLIAAINNTNSDETTDAKWTLELYKTAGFKFINKQVRRLETAGFKFINKQVGRLGWIDEHNIADKDKGMKFEFIPCAAELHAAGVEFRKKKFTGNPFEINFKNGVMEIPTFKNGGTERFYRNLIAYEHYNKEANDRFVGCHAKLMDCLIESADDVALLRSFGIVGGFLGENEASSSIFVTKAQSSTIFEEVNAYCGKQRHRWMATLKKDYFNSPWALISFLGALFLLLLTLTQTVFSILSVV